MENIWEFLVRAKKNTYADGDSARVASSRLGSKDYHCEQIVNNQKLTYHDTYFGGEKFIGCEVVYVNNYPLWAMSYNGYSIKNFTGLERIYKNNILIYELNCSGGLIK